jgi:hypothetical protein
MIRPVRVRIIPPIVRQSINPKHLANSGPLVHFNVDEAQVCVRTPEESRKLLHLGFGRDGGIFAQFPYFHDPHGVLKELVFPDGRAFPTVVSTAEEASVVSHFVKYSHHIDGEAHFSQDGKVVTKVRRRSFRLDGPIGHLFQMNAVDLAGFERLPEPYTKKRRPSIEFTYRELPKAVNITANWERKSMLNRLIVGSRLDNAGPVLTVATLDGSESQDWIILSPPGGTSEHALVLKCFAAKPAEGIDRSSVVFIGGWDYHEVTDPRDVPTHTGALFCMYPVDSAAMVAAGLESLDFTPEAATSDQAV